MALLRGYKQGLNETGNDLNREEWKFIRHAKEEFGRDVELVAQALDVLFVQLPCD